MFGATSQSGGGLFGNQQQQQQQNNATSGGFSFGQPQQTASSFSFGNQQQQPQQQQQSLFANSQQQTQPNFSWSKPNDSRPFGASQQLQQQQQQPSLLEQQQPQQQQQQTGAPSVVDQLNIIRSSWDPTSPSCAFQYYFYNRVPQQQVALYVKPANENQIKWDKAISSRPDNSCVPVIAIGFTDLKKRILYQINQINAYRIRMHEINDKLSELQSRHDLYTTIKIKESKSRHETILQRSIRLAAKVQLLRCRGFSLRPQEEILKMKFEELQKEIKDPSVFGRISEIWAKLSILRERLNNNNNLVNGASSSSSIDWERDQDELDKIVKILKEQQQGIAYLISVIKQDESIIDEKKFVI